MAVQSEVPPMRGFELEHLRTRVMALESRGVMLLV